MASPNEREENLINIWGLETFLLHCERKKWHSVVQSGNHSRGNGGGQMRPTHWGGEQIASVVEIPRNTEVEGRLPEVQMVTYLQGESNHEDT